jgi:hypothetical protein
VTARGRADSDEFAFVRAMLVSGFGIGQPPFRAGCGHALPQSAGRRAPSHPHRAALIVEIVVEERLVDIVAEGSARGGVVTNDHMVSVSRRAQRSAPLRLFIEVARELAVRAVRRRPGCAMGLKPMRTGARMEAPGIGFSRDCTPRRGP